MKKYLLTFALISIFTLSSTNNSEAYKSSPVFGQEGLGGQWDPLNYPVNVKLNQKYLKFDSAPRIINGRGMVPMRNIFEAMGTKIEWNQKTKTVIATKGTDIIKLTIGKKQAEINGKQVTLDVPAQVIKDRTLVPVRFVSEGLNKEITWDSKTNTAEIKTTKGTSGKLYNFSDFESTYIDLKPFLKQNGNPTKTDKIYNPAYEGYDKKLTYDFATATFIDSYDDYMLSELYTTKSLSNIPRGIKIGDSVETLLSKFPSNGNYDNTKNAYSEIKDYINEDEKIIYYSLNESSMGTIKHDASGNVKAIEYSLNFDTSEANSTMTFEIVNNKIYSISVYRPVC